MKKLTKNQKEKMYKILYIISFMMLILFCIRIILDYFMYNPYENSNPFYMWILLRILEYIFPSIIILILTNIVKNRNEKKEKENENYESSSNV